MIDRIFDQMQLRRRHVAFLVALLVLTFALTVALTVRARRAEVARQAQTQSMLQALVGSAASDWGDQIGRQAVEGLKPTLYRAHARLIADVDLSLDDFAGRTDLANFCVECPDALLTTTFFSLDLRTGETEYVRGQQRLSAAMRNAVEANIARGAAASLHDLLDLALYVEEHGGSVEAVAVSVRRDEDGRPLRAMGFFIPAAALQQMITVVFDNLKLLPPSMVRGLPNSAIFSPRAHVGNAVVPVGVAHDEGVATRSIGNPAGGSSAGDLVTAGSPAGDLVTARAGPATTVPGLHVEVGLSEQAAAALLMPGGLTSDVPVLLGLLSAIGMLIILALLLVRREAELVRLRAGFIASVSHELRTPLAQVRMFTETLLLGRVRSDVERRRSLEIIDQEARRLTHLVENILLFSKSDGGRQPMIRPVPAAFANEIRLAAESFAPLCRASMTEIRTELQEDIIVSVDRGALRQTMVNLIDNALKYGPEGQRVTVGAALFDDVARVWVDDEGPGIPLDQRERVFESFYRMPRDIDSSSSGSGIGLAVVRELARLHGGSTRAETAPGGGARLLVELPGAYLREEPAADLSAAS